MEEAGCGHHPETADLDMREEYSHSGLKGPLAVLVTIFRESSPLHPLLSFKQHSLLRVKERETFTF